MAVKALAWNTYFWKMLEGYGAAMLSLPVKLQKSGIPRNVLYNGGSRFTRLTRRRASSLVVSIRLDGLAFDLLMPLIEASGKYCQDDGMAGKRRRG